MAINPLSEIEFEKINDEYCYGRYGFEGFSETLKSVNDIMAQP